MTIAHVDLSGSGHLNMHWVKGSNALVLATHDSATLTLAGIAKTVSAEAFDSSHVDLRFLRAQTVFMRTMDYTRADLWANKYLYVFADNSSHIYYYKKPKYLYQRLAHAGSVLPMMQIPSALIHFTYS